MLKRNNVRGTASPDCEIRHGISGNFRREERHDSSGATHS
jgi:hypothetical protein